MRGEYNLYSKISFVNIESPPSKVEVTFDPYQQNMNKNLIFPFFSKRNTYSYSKSIKKSDREKVTGDLSNLHSRVDFLSTPRGPISTLYREACINILGFFVGTDADDDGKYAAYAIDDHRSIPITSMGDGIPHILGLITNLCLANNKIFLIEEPENDIHPQALKGLLKLIEEKSDTNQFFISTHSNIVLRQLGANKNTKIFQIEKNEPEEKIDNIPSSIIKTVSDDPGERLKILEDLGYDVFDYALWKGWLFLEESSAETIINEILIPNFVPSLQNKIKTFPASGFDGISEKFTNFSNLFIYAHLDALYKNRAWVLIDSGEKEAEEIKKLKKNFPDWDHSKHFLQLSRHDFEEFYPARFKDRIKQIIDVGKSSLPIDKRKTNKRQLKISLLREVIDWYKTEKEAAVAELAISAYEVIETLKSLEKSLS